MQLLGDSLQCLILSPGAGGFLRSYLRNQLNVMLQWERKNIPEGFLRL